MTTRRLYYDDSFVREFDANVVGCDQVVHHGSTAWEVLLDSTAFYPSSGGQPHDLGRLGDARVLDVRDQDTEIVHVIDQPICKGDVHGCLDWPRRFDHMQQHTGQHLLSAMFQERFGRPTVSFHLGQESCTIDLRGDQPTDAILEGAERAANQVIFEDRPVTTRYGTAQQLAELGVRKEVDRTGILRAIEIEGADLQPCGGTHVKRTAQIGMILVRRCSKIRQDWRVEFVCGARAERTARRDFQLLQIAADRLGCPPLELTATAERVMAERDAHFKNFRGALERLAQAEASLALQSTPPGADGIRLIDRVFQEDAQSEYLNHLATQLAKSENSIALLAMSPSGDLIFAQHPSAGRDMNVLLKGVAQQLGGKGGGTKDFARGRLDDAAKVQQAISLAKELAAKA